MMNDIQAKDVIVGLYEQLLDYHHGLLKDQRLWDKDPNLALYTVVHVDIQNHGYEADGNTHHPEWEIRYIGEVHVVITARHRVYTAITNWPTNKIPEPSLFTNQSNHDSCWPEGLDVIRKTLMEANEVYNSRMPKTNHKVPAETTAAGFNKLGVGFIQPKPLNFVRVSRSPIPGDNYHDQLTEIKPVKFAIQILD